MSEMSATFQGTPDAPPFEPEDGGCEWQELPPPLPLDVEEEFNRLSFPETRPVDHYEVKSGKLHIRTGTAVAVLRPWPIMLAHKKLFFRKQPRWFYFRPEMDLSTGCVEIERARRRTVVRYDDYCDPPPPLAAEETPETAAVRQYFDPIPQSVWESVARFKYRQWHLLALAARCPGTLDLLNSNPALAFALASNWAFHQPAVSQPLRAARSLIRRRQTEIAAWLGFPGCKSAVNILRKIPPGACQMPSLFYLRDVMSSPETMKLLAHLPTVNVTVIRVLSDPQLARLASPSLLLELTDGTRKPGRIAGVVRLLRDIRLMLDARGQPNGVQALRSVAQVQARHDELMDWMIRHGVLWNGYRDRTFQPPPLAETDTLRAVTSMTELLDEGRQQFHCAAAYGLKVLRGEVYFYRVLGPERATLCLAWTPAGWRISELSGYANAPVSPATRQKVAHWLEAGQSKAEVPGERNENQDLKSL